MANQSRIEELKSEKLRKVSDGVYQEANPPVDQRRPLEWRRDFNFVGLPLKNIQIVSNFSVHDRPLDIDKLFEPNHDDSPWQRIRPEIKTERFIKAIVDQEKFHDAILCTVTDSDQEITRLAKPSGEMEVAVRVGTPFEGNEQVPSGIYTGSCSLINADEEIDEDYLCFDVYLPKEHLNDLLEYLVRDTSPRIQIGLYLFSFSYDHHLVHWSQPRYLFIEDPTVTVVTTVNTSSFIGAKVDIDQEHRPEESSLQSPVDLSSVTRALGRLTVALWVLVAIIGYLLIK